MSHKLSRPVPEIIPPAERRIIRPRSRQAELGMLRDLTRLLREYRLYLKRRNDRLERHLPKMD